MSNHDTFRMVVDRSSSVAGRGTTVAGRVKGGSVEVARRVRIRRRGSDLSTIVTGIQRNGRDVRRADTGDEVELTLRGLRPRQITAGAVVEGLSTPTRRSGAAERQRGGVRAEVVRLLREGKKIQAIKHYRQETGVGLKVAKEAVEAIEARIEDGDIKQPGDSEFPSTGTGKDRPRTRSGIEVPIAPSSRVTDELLFESPDDANEKWYVPRYRLSVEGNRFRVSLRESRESHGGTLSLELERGPATSIRGIVERTDARELEHEVAVLVRYSRPSSTIQQELTFASEEIQETDQGGLAATLGVDTPEKLATLFQALKDSAYQTELVVQRTVRVAVRMAEPKAQEAAAEQAVQELEERISQTKQRLEVLKEQRPQRKLGGPFGTKIRDTIKVRTATKAFQEAQQKALRKKLVKLQEELKQKRQERDDAKEPRFHARQVTLDQVLEPSTFDPDQQPQIFRGVTHTETTRGGMRHLSVAWKNGGRSEFHSYFQDQVEPNRFYYLPDRFRLTRTRQPGPDLLVRFRTDEQEGTLVELEYVGVPYADPERLQAAADTLQRRHAHEFPLGTGLVLDPLRLVEEPSLWLRVPGTGTRFEEQEGVSIRLDRDIRGGLTLPLEAFERLFHQMLGEGRIFSGEVRFAIGPEDDRKEFRIDFPWNFRDLDGEVLEYDDEPLDDGAGLRTILRNAIESPVRIRDGTARLLTSTGTLVEAELRGVDLPVELAPGEEVAGRTVATGSAGGEEIVGSQLDPAAVEVLPDDEALLEAILESQVGMMQERTVEVRIFEEEIAAGVPGIEDSTVLAVVVELENGDTVLFDPESCTSSRCSEKATVRVPLTDVILRRSHSGTYGYRITAHFVAGEGSPDEVQSERIETDADILFVSLDHLRPQPEG